MHNVAVRLARDQPVQSHDHLTAGRKSDQTDVGIVWAYYQIVHYQFQEISHKSPVVAVDGVTVAINFFGGILVTDTAGAVHNEHQIDHGRGTDD